MRVVLLLLATFAPVALSHSLVVCTDLSADAQTCNGYRRHIERYLGGGASRTSGSDGHVTRSATRLNVGEAPCSQEYHQAASAYDVYPMATAAPNSKLRISWPANNHQFGGSPGIPDSRNNGARTADIFMSTSAQPPASILDTTPYTTLDYSNCVTSFNQELVKGSAQPTFLCYGDITMPSNPGKYTFVWFWKLGGSSVYSSCWDVDVGGTPVDRPTGGAVPVDGPTTTSGNVPDSCRDGRQTGFEDGVDCGGFWCDPCTTSGSGLGFWVTTAYSSCSRSCGGGVMSRTATCKDSSGNILSDSSCSAQHKPELTMSCNERSCRGYTWAYGKWGSCSASCGSGYQQRDIYCLDQVTIISDSFCEAGTRPDWYQRCDAGSCFSPAWKLEPAECSEPCGGGVRTFTNPECVDPDGNPVASTECAELPEGEPCNTWSCDSEGEWEVCEWEPCTATCGGAGGQMMGVQYRQVQCKDEAGNVLGDAACAHYRKPDQLQEGCNPEACNDANWMTTVWSDCLNGKRSRTTHCHLKDGSNAASNDECPQSKKPHLEEDCDPDACPRSTPDSERPGAGGGVTINAGATAAPGLALLAVALCALVL